MLVKIYIIYLDQEAALESLSGVVRSQKNIAKTIHNEVEDQDGKKSFLYYIFPDFYTTPSLLLMYYRIAA